LSNAEIQIHLVIVHQLNTRKPIASQTSNGETSSHFSCVGQQQLLAIVTASSEMRAVFKSDVLLNSCGSAIVSVGDVEAVRALCLQQMSLLVDQEEEDENLDAGPLQQYFAKL
jgi:hypothetical protein